MNPFTNIAAAMLALLVEPNTENADALVAATQDAAAPDSALLAAALLEGLRQDEKAAAAAYGLVVREAMHHIVTYASRDPS